MDFGRYLQWMDMAPVQARVAAVRPLVSAWANAGDDRERATVLELMLSALLDDRSTDVRHALSEAVAHSLDAPRHLVVALAQDQPAVALPVLRASPLLSDADLVDAVAVGDVVAQTAVAERSHVSASTAAALAEVGHRDALVFLCGNPGADIPPCATRRMVERFGEDAAVREALLARDNLDPGLRHDLAVATARALTRFAMACDWMTPERADRVSRESREKAAVTIAARSARENGVKGPRRLAVHLRAAGHLTPALLLRSVLSGDTMLLEAALAELSGLPHARVAGHVQAPSGLGFTSLYGRAAMPPALLPVFQVALANATLAGSPDHKPGTLMRPVIRRVLALCTKADAPDLAPVAALLRRLEAEAVSEEIRAAARMPAETSEPFVLDGEDMKPWMIAPSRALPRLPYRSAA